MRTVTCAALAREAISHAPKTEAMPPATVAASIQVKVVMRAGDASEASETRAGHATGQTAEERAIIR